MPETIVAVAAPSLAAAVASAADIARLPLLDDEQHSAQRLVPDWQTWLISQGVPADTPLRIRHFGDSNLVIQAATAGLGIALVWRSLVDDDLRTGRLVHLLEQTMATRMAFHLVMPPNRLAVPKIAAFREWLLETAKISPEETPEP